MALIEVNKNPSQNDLRWFGVILLAFFGMIGGIAVWRFNAWTVAITLWTAAVIVVAAYYLLPPIRKPLFVGWMYAVLPIGMTISFVIMLLTYYLVLTPIGLMLRLFSVKFFDPQPANDAESYWTPHPTVTAKRRYFQQF